MTQYLLKERIMKCPRCKGRKYIELDKIGLRVMSCPDCDGKGEIDDISDIAEGFVPVGSTDTTEGYTTKEEIPITLTVPDYVEKLVNDDNSGTNRDDQPTRSPDSSKPTKPKKRKTKSKATKRTR